MPEYRSENAYNELQERESGHELCIGVYCSSDDDTVYYDSYHVESGEAR